jgi:TonB-dependent receptor
MSYVNQRGADQVDIGDGTTCIGAGSTVFDGLSGDEAEESIPADWTTEENIFASYVMGTTTIDNATFVYGVRYEDTETTLMGKDVNADFDYQGVLTYEKNYGFTAPSLNIKYELDDTSLVRLAAYRSFVRPGFNESKASLIINVEDNEIEGGNPLLDPITAWNFDIGYEKYFGPESAAGFGFFYKKLEDAIYQVQSDNIVVIGQTWDQAATYINSGESIISGFEIFGQTTWDNGLFVAANITLSDSESDLPADSVAGNRAVPYVKNADTTWNLTFGYDQGPWDVRFATNYRSAYLDELGDAPLYDRYTNDYMTMDLSASYSINDQLEFRGELININSAPEFYYFGNTSRLSQYDEYGPTVSFGFRYDLVN